MIKSNKYVQIEGLAHSVFIYFEREQLNENSWVMEQDLMRIDVELACHDLRVRVGQWARSGSRRASPSFARRVLERRRMIARAEYGACLERFIVHFYCSCRNRLLIPVERIITHVPVLSYTTSH